ncbi:cobalt-precorrin-5B (C(1))-methyltransferase CbiD [Synechococcus sp. MIT S9504]|uniref:cobalt-precorrin-5B (C(1))-methyltransferase CbiD n=1 Tax=Synechococcus sp. MIT S9504 TaxID=1801628 RepID=UPI00082BF6A3|nr:cobalt-precorrin-5B (C(1))-methyltransferase CbiD [Synechococcus sp. MIT S9504]
MATTHAFSGTGLTLPVWVAAAARAAALVLAGSAVPKSVDLRIPSEQGVRRVEVHAASLLDGGQKALAISICDPGTGLDLTRGLEIWVLVSRSSSRKGLQIHAGQGVGRLKQDGSLCISGFARELLELNLSDLLPVLGGLDVEVVLPRGRELALRTSNSAFGVVEGLALIGTQAEVQTSASPDQLQLARERLRELTDQTGFAGRLTLVIGENGLDLAQQLGLSDQQPLLKSGNWIGPLLVAAAESRVQQLLVLGYHGKLIKLAGGIFHTHHHLADARLEVLAALAVQQDLSLESIRALLQAASIEQAWGWLQAHDREQAMALWMAVAEAVEGRSEAYLKRYGCTGMHVGAALFNRERQLHWAGPEGRLMLRHCGVQLHPVAADSGQGPSLR